MIIITIIIIIITTVSRSREASLLTPMGPRRRDPYTQFAIQDSGLFGPDPWKILAPPSNYLSKQGFWATQPLEQILDSEFLLCELGVPRFGEDNPLTQKVV